MGKMYTESELLAMGLTREQIDSVANEVEEEKPVNIVKTFEDKVNEEVNKPLKVTSISELKEQASGEIVELPGFIDGGDFVVKMRRPSLLAMVKKGKIPNALLSEATELFTNGTASMAKGKNSDNQLEQMMDVVEIICESSLIEPSWKEIQENGIELTDEQLMAIFAYSQRGIAAVKQFRNQR